MYGCSIIAWLLLGALGILAYQGILWLHDGYWTAFSLSDVLTLVGLQMPVFEWRGLGKIVYWLLDQWVGWCLVAFAVPLGWVGFWIEDVAQRWEQRSLERAGRKKRRQLGYTDEEEEKE